MAISVLLKNEKNFEKINKSLSLGFVFQTIRKLRIIGVMVDKALIFNQLSNYSRHLLIIGFLRDSNAF
ncbi:MAG: hypothetical protein MUE85_10680 [Microscillaceae bacterium]|jgi:hypothetical protein|nr:hypothetical protein [Microscillaceae bacterium]